MKLPCLAALAVDADYIAFVGSSKKADSLKASLVKRGISDERLAKLKAPCRSRSRRNHTGRNCNLDSGRNCRRAATQGSRGRTRRAFKKGDFVDETGGVSSRASLRLRRPA